MQVPVKLDIPTKYVKNFMNGSVDISKAVVRNTKNGKIVKNINLIKDIDKAKDVARSLRRSKLFLVGLGITAIVATASGIVYLVNRKNNKEDYIQIPECVLNFQDKFKKYLRETQQGILNIQTIDELIVSLNEVEKVQKSDFKMDFTIKELKTLLSRIYEFTNDVAKINNITINIKRPSNDSLDNVTFLKDYLKAQKNIVENVS